MSAIFCDLDTLYFQKGQVVQCSILWFGTITHHTDIITRIVESQIKTLKATNHAEYRNQSIYIYICSSEKKDLCICLKNVAKIVTF